MPVETLAPGMRVLCRDAEWLITRIEAADQNRQHYCVHCVGTDDLVRGHEVRFLTAIDTIEPIDPRKTKLVPDTSNGFKLAKLYLEAQVRSMPATGEEPHVEGMGAFDPMPFQIRAVRRALQQMRPRLLLADAVGLGKTIQVGMILTELLRRGRADRILVLTKKSMLAQFQSELWNRFAIPLTRLDSQGIARLRLKIPANKNPFEVYHRVIISIDTLKDIGRYRHFIDESRWDAIVIDEAHNVAGASVPHRHLAYRLATLLARRCDSLLLTTATPHNGKREVFGRLISLLDPSIIPDPGFKEYRAEDIRPFFLMRFKEDIKNESPDNFTERTVVPPAATTVVAHAEEEKVYRVLGALRRSVRTANAPQQDRLLQWGLYKLFLSSPESCRSTVEKRHAHIQATDPNSAELTWLSQIRTALGAQRLRTSSRYALLKRELQALGWNGGPNCPRLLIFTEYRHSQQALWEAIAQDFNIPVSPKPEDVDKQVIACAHGSMADIHLMATVEAFGTGSSPMRLLIATDVASEGINLHHQCHHIVHYDLPWSIITLVQRNGRIDRYGQRKRPVLRYLRVATEIGDLQGDTVIFDRLIDKVEEINRSTRAGESILKLYDADQENEWVATRGLIGGDTTIFEHTASPDAAAEAKILEDVLDQARDGKDLLADLLGDDVPAPAPNASAIAGVSRIRNFDNRRYLLEGYRYLRQHRQDYPDIEEGQHLITLTPPPDLTRRLGGGDNAHFFGSTAIPSEAWPEHGRFRLTADPARAMLAIQAARNTKGQWSQELLLTEQHPMLTWLNERLLMQMDRGQAPYIASPKLRAGTLWFCCIGQVCSRAGTPLVVDAHAVRFSPGGDVAVLPLAQALAEAGFATLGNTGQGDSQARMAAPALVHAAVDKSLEYLTDLKADREKHLKPYLVAEERRMRAWRQERETLLQAKINHAELGAPQVKGWQTQLNELADYVRDRTDNWRATWFDAHAQPSTRVVLVIEGSGK